MELDRYLTAANALRGPTRVEPFFLFQENRRNHTVGPHAKNKSGAHTRSMPLCIEVLRQKIHQLERTPAVDHLVDQIAFTAR